VKISFNGVVVDVDMTISTHKYGNKIYTKDGHNWFYEDGTPSDDEVRPCPRCNRMPTPEGYDACAGYVEGAKSVCCGHGVSEPILMLKQG
jgi:hypothetical protein